MIGSGGLQGWCLYQSCPPGISNGTSMTCPSGTRRLERAGCLYQTCWCQCPLLVPWDSYTHAGGFSFSRDKLHPKTLIEIAMVLSTNSGSFPSNSHFSATFSILLRFGESWNPTNCKKFNADGSLMGRTNLDKSAW